MRDPSSALAPALLLPAGLALAGALPPAHPGRAPCAASRARAPAGAKRALLLHASPSQRQLPAAISFCYALRLPPSSLPFFYVPFHLYAPPE